MMVLPGKHKADISHHRTHDSTRQANAMLNEGTQHHVKIHCAFFELLVKLDERQHEGEAESYCIVNCVLW